MNRDRRLFQPPRMLSVAPDGIEARRIRDGDGERWVPIWIEPMRR